MNSDTSGRRGAHVEAIEGNLDAQGLVGPAGEKIKVLVIEDQGKLGQFIKRRLTDAGLMVTCVTSGAAGDDAINRGSYDVVLLDLMLPDRDGLDLLREWRHRRVNVPVLILSARNSVRDRVQGLELGADDYLPKPFSMGELYARVRALTRRKAEFVAQLYHRDVVFNVGTRVVTRGDLTIDLKEREKDLLQVFMENAGRTLTRGMLAENVWTHDYDVDSNLLEVYMSRLRAKLETGEGKPFFETVRGMGYRLI